MYASALASKNNDTYMQNANIMLNGKIYDGEPEPLLPSVESVDGIMYSDRSYIGE